MGSSAASATCLRALMREDELEIVGVVTQPDRPVGRGKVVTPCPCKASAVASGITEIITPENVNAPEALDQIRAWRPDVIAVVAFGQFLKKSLLDLPLFGCINCHFSLLPKYRGASPVIAALAAGDRLTGVSVMRMGLGMDDGPILLQSYEPIYSDVTGGELMDGLAVTGGVTLAKALKLMNRNALPPPVRQCAEEATYAHKLKKTDGLVDWREPVVSIHRRIRAYTPWPGGYTFLPARFRKKGNSGRLVILKAEIVGKIPDAAHSTVPGEIIALDRRGPLVRCGDTALLLVRVKPEGAGEMDGSAFLRGRNLAVGDILLPA
jgi:methionyl-tRNA formyltransferase